MLMYNVVCITILIVILHKMYINISILPNCYIHILLYSTNQTAVALYKYISLICQLLISGDWCLICSNSIKVFHHVTSVLIFLLRRHHSCSNLPCLYIVLIQYYYNLDIKSYTSINFKYSFTLFMHCRANDNDDDNHSCHNRGHH